MKTTTLRTSTVLRRRVASDARDENIRPTSCVRGRPGRGAREEHLQQPLVPQFEDLRLDLEPALELLAAGRGQPVLGSLATAARLRAALDQPRLRQLAQLGVDLAVARRPEEASRVVHDRLDLVPGLGPLAKEAEDHVGGAVELHITAQYITRIYRADGCVSNVTRPDSTAAAAVSRPGRCAGMPRTRRRTASPGRAPRPGGCRSR